MEELPTQSGESGPIAENQQEVVPVVAEDSESESNDKGTSEEPSSKKDVAREDSYEWGRVLGEGTFGSVRHAIHKVTGKEYAVKQILKKFLLDKKKNKDIVFREREILNKLGAFPLIVQLHSTFQNPSSLFFVMDYCPNGELYSWLKKMKRFDMELTRHYIAETVLALEYIHEQGVMHRDLKPENILLGPDFHIKIIDFGTAKIVGKGRSGSFEGTPEYMSPELLIQNECDVRCDLWALGVMTFQLLSGSLPFRGDNPWATIERVKAREFSYPNDFSEVARDFCDRLMCSDPDQRLGSNGMSDLKAHPFFEGIDFNTVAVTTPPPFVLPQINETREPDQVPPPSDSPNLENPVENTILTANLSPVPLSNSTTSESATASNVTDAVVAPSPASGSVASSSSQWNRFLNAGETVVREGVVYKKRRAFNVKKRQLLLTSSGRLVYLEVKSDADMSAKGSISCATITKVESKGNSSFTVTINTKRVYQFEVKDKSATAWAEAIRQLIPRN